MFRWYSAHVAGFVEIGCRSRAVAFVLASVALDKDAGYDDEEDGAEGEGEGDEDDEADGHVSAYVVLVIRSLKRKLGERIVGLT